MAHRADHAVTNERPLRLPRSKLTAPVGVQDAAGDVTTATSSGVVDRVHREAGLHAAVDRVADSAVGSDVFDRAQVELALAGLGSVMSVSHNSSSPAAVESRFTRSSWAGVPGFEAFDRFLPNTDYQPLSRQIRHTVRSDTSNPAARTSSARNR